MTETFVWPVDDTSIQAVIGDAHVVDSVKNYYWMVIVGGILAFVMAWGIGANDVANAFATSVGAGSLTLPMACVIAAVMEFAGALLLGGNVSDTVRKKIINVDIFDPNKADGAANGPEMLMTGFLVALLAGTTWLIIATYFALPVSTTHSIIGALIGVGLAYRGGSAVIWWPSGSGFNKLKGVVGVIISWIVSPVLSGIIAVIFFLLVRHLVLRRQDPFKNGLLFIPVFYGITLTIAVFFIVYKGDKRFDLEERLGTGGALGVAFGAGILFAIFSAFILVPLARKSVERWEAREQTKAKNPDAFKEQEDRSKKINDTLSKIGLHLDIEEDLNEDVVRMHDNVEKFDPKTERLFTWVQVFTAAVDAFAHGANDVANAIAPFTSIYQLHRNNGLLSEAKKSKFSSAGKFSGGDFNGTTFEEGESIPDHGAFCGKDGDDSFYSCTESPVFPYTDQVPSGAQTKEFTIYDSNGVAQTDPASGTAASGTCSTECNPRNLASYKSSKQDVPLWILALGGVGIVAGLAMWGYRIILAIGVKLTKLTPSRGFSIEIGAAITVLIASDVGIPVSTTHCQVGATMGVGLVELKASTVNWKQFFFICLGWVFTVVFTGFLSAILYLVITYSPLNISVPQGPLANSADTLDFCPGNRVFVYDEEANLFRGVRCSGINDV